MQIGVKVRVKDVSSGRETLYTLVSAIEAKPLEGKISNVSPIGKSLLGTKVGEVTEVNAPSGKIKLEIISIK